ncbi:serine/threonine-protein phosphatase 7 long form homolog [Henckelia pumila]|uniref:serine/threonine-protein phosphatase 7 long form homolog n=1 Tax=Henckelia pumila TaxID=405737 RepID=UPI003C6E3526
MVEKWHQETHTFHLPVGETTINLQDVAMIWGLNIDGIPVTGVDTAYSKNELQQRCLYWMTAQMTTWQKYSRCVALLIIGGCMFPDSESSAVKLMYLPFLQDIDRICVWSRITLLTPDMVQQSHLASEQVADVLQGLSFPPYGAKWKRGFSWVHTVRHSVRIMRDMLDRIIDGQFKWTVYDMESPELSIYLQGNRNLLCRSACLLINFDIVEIHRPERCLRQFGMRQGIPPPATNYDIFHKLTRQGRPNYDWAAFHKQFVDMWTDRYNFVMNGEFIIPGTPDTTLEYIGWYRRISHIFVSPTQVPATMVGYHPIDGRYRQSFPFMHDIRPRLNISPISFQEYSDIPITEMNMSTVGPSTTPAQPRTEGDEEERYGRGHRIIVRPRCGTGGHRYHHH